MLLHSAAAYFSFGGIISVLVLTEAECNVKHAGQGMLLSSHMVTKSYYTTLIQLFQYL